ncbi:MAG: YIP1 family protein [Pseudomonadota bacterium]
MAITTEIFRSYWAPRDVMRRLLAAGQREDRAIAYLMGACALIFVAQWPRLQREAMLDPDGPPLEALISAALFGWIFIVPLFAYGVAALSHIIAGLLGGRGAWWGARIALFWSLLAISPLMLLNGLVEGFIGEGLQLQVTWLLTTLAFFWIWGISLVEAERSPSSGSGAEREA